MKIVIVDIVDPPPPAVSIFPLWEKLVSSGQGAIPRVGTLIRDQANNNLGRPKLLPLEPPMWVSKAVEMSY